MIVRRECGDDEELRREAESLLAAHLYVYHVPNSEESDVWVEKLN